MTITIKSKARIAMFLCALLWSIGGVIIKVIQLNAFTISGVRSLLAVGVLYLYMRHRSLSFSFDKYNIIVAVGICLNLTAYVVATKLTAVANAVMIANTSAVFIIIFSALLYKKLPNRAEVLTVMFSFLGVGLFFFDSLSSGNLNGDALALFASIARGVIYMAAAKSSTENSGITGIIFGHILTAAAGIIIGFFYPNELNLISLGGVLVLGLLQTGLAYVFYTYAVRNLAPLECSLIAITEPIIAPIWVFLAIGEIPGTLSMIGGAIVIVTVVTWCIRSRK